MRKIQEADVWLAETPHEESYDFYIDISDTMEKLGKYQAKYYRRCEQEGLTIQEALEELGEYLRSNLTVVHPRFEEEESA